MAFLNKTIVTDKPAESGEVLRLLVARVMINDELTYLNRDEKEFVVKDDGAIWLSEVGGDGHMYLYPDELAALQKVLQKARCCKKRRRKLAWRAPVDTGAAT